MRRTFLILRKLEAFVLTWSMVSMAAVTILNALARNLLDRSFAAAEELNQFLIVLICFVGLSHAASQGRHIRMTALYDRLDARPRKALMTFICGSSSLLMFALAWFAFDYVRGVERVSPVLGVPLRVVYSAAPIGFVLTGIQYGLACARNFTRSGIWIAYDLAEEHIEAGEAPSA